jgi:hypothetical protein
VYDLRSRGARAAVAVGKVEHNLSRATRTADGLECDRSHQLLHDGFRRLVVEQNHEFFRAESIGYAAANDGCALQHVVVVIDAEARDGLRQLLTLPDKFVRNHRLRCYADHVTLRGAGPGVTTIRLEPVAAAAVPTAQDVPKYTGLIFQSCTFTPQLRKPAEEKRDAA